MQGGWGAGAFERFVITNWNWRANKKLVNKNAIDNCCRPSQSATVIDISIKARIWKWLSNWVLIRWVWVFNNPNLYPGLPLSITW